MKIIVSAKLDKPELNIDHRPEMLSFLKNAFIKSNNDLYEKYYGNLKTRKKNFCFSEKLDSPQFNDDIINFKSNNIVITIYTYNFEDGIDIYNSILAQKNIRYPFPDGNGFTVYNVKLSNHKQINKNMLHIKMYSPLLVRCHENGKDYYVPFDSPDFKKYFKMSVENYFLSENLPYDHSIDICPINPKKTVVTTFGNKITANIGVYQLIGSTEVLNVLYQSGIGARRSQGFGLFEII